MSGTRSPEDRFEIRRIYEPGHPHDGYRVLVDRLWPRGVSKAAAALDEWLKEAAPSTELRRWFDHKPSRFTEFSRRYREELAHGGGRAAVEHLVELGRAGPVILLTATRDLEHSGALVLLGHIRTTRWG